MLLDKEIHMPVFYEFIVTLDSENLDVNDIASFGSLYP